MMKKFSLSNILICVNGDRIKVLKRFKFSLESVFVVKQKLLEDERLELARMMEEKRAQQDVLDGLNHSLLEVQKEYDEVMGKEINVSLMMNYDVYSKKLLGEIASQKEVLKQMASKLFRQQNKVKAAYIATKTLEKLKEKQKEAYDKECLEEEFKLIDDIVSSRRISA